MVVELFLILFKTIMPDENKSSKNREAGKIQKNGFLAYHVHMAIYHGLVVVVIKKDLNKLKSLFFYKGKHEHNLVLVY